MNRKSNRSREHRRCAWCFKEVSSTAVDIDHIFPRSLGGTRELSVPSCRKCQQSVSSSEFELARRSNYGLYLVNGGASGRNKRKPRSGLIESRYLLVPHPFGGYSEAILRAGSDTPEALPYVEIDTRTQQARVRAPAPAGIDRIVEIVRTKLATSPAADGLVAEFDVRTNDLHEIASDPDFWPRIVLEPGDRVFIRARNPEEAVAFMGVFVSAMQAGAFRERSGWQQAEIKGGTVHSALISFDWVKVNRIALKIAVGLALYSIGEENWSDGLLTRARAAVLGRDDTFVEEAVAHLREPDGSERFGAMHVAAILNNPDAVTTFVSIFGSLERVTLTNEKALLRAKGVVAVSRHDCMSTKLVTGDEALAILHSFTNV